jgi:hypothetical protein
MTVRGLCAFVLPAEAPVEGEVIGLGVDAKRAGGGRA